MSSDYKGCDTIGDKGFIYSDIYPVVVKMNKIPGRQNQ